MKRLQKLIFHKFGIPRVRTRDNLNFIFSYSYSYSCSCSYSCFRSRFHSSITGKSFTSLALNHSRAEPNDLIHKYTVNKLTPLTGQNTKTLHEESAGGLNGRLAQFAHSLSSSASADLLDFYAQLGPSDRSQLNLTSYNYVLGALLNVGKQMEAFKLINELETKSSTNIDRLQFPDRTSFLILMRGLVEADSSGSLALAVNEIFELMRRKHQFEPDLSAWSLRIRAFLHNKFIYSTNNKGISTLNISSSSSSSGSGSDNDNNPNANGYAEPSRIFYHEMINFYKDCFDTKSELNHAVIDPAINFNIELDNLRAELIITAVNRRLWTFAEWMLSELSNSITPTTLSSVSVSVSSNSFSIWDKILTSTGLFNDSASIPILRQLKNSLHQGRTLPSHSISNSIGFNTHLLFYCWRQGRLTADLAIKALKILMNFAPDQSKIWLETAEGCLSREWPRDLNVYNDHFNSEIRERIMANILKSKCPNYLNSIKELERDIRNYKLIM